MGTILLQESDDRQYHLVAFASRELKGGELKYHSSQLEFLALKLAITEQFQEYLQYQPFNICTDNNLEYLKGSHNKVADALSRVSTQKLDEETMAELLNFAWNGSTPWAEMANIHVIEEGECVDQEVIVQYTQIVKQHKQFRNLTNLDWVKAQSKALSFPR